jgi:hypothetical protein
MQMLCAAGLLAVAGGAMGEVGSVQFQPVPRLADLRRVAPKLAV